MVCSEPGTALQGTGQSQSLLDGVLIVFQAADLQAGIGIAAKLLEGALNHLAIGAASCGQEQALTFEILHADGLQGRQGCCSGSKG